MSKAIIGVRGGHSPNCTGASGYLNEQAEVRNASYKLIDKLRQRGYTVVDCNSNAGSVNAELNEGTYKARNCDIYLPLHMNDADNKSANGCECWCYGSNSKKAIEIGNNINRNLSTLGLFNRGIKFDAGLHDTNSVSGQTCLVELLFCGNKGDTDIYKKVGIDRIVEILAQSIDGNVVGKPSISAPVKPVSTYTPVKLGEVIADVLNIREHANTNSNVLDSLKKDDKVRVAGLVDGFYSIFYKEHGAWVSAKYIKDITPKPVPKPTTPVVPVGKLYKIQAGAFKSKIEADQAVASLKSKGVDSFIKLV